MLFSFILGYGVGGVNVMGMLRLSKLFEDFDFLLCFEEWIFLNVGSRIFS